jgi:hypothetical protein
MKKIFLFIGIAAFTSATAQQKDVLDIDKYILKQQQQKKKAAKKEIPVFSFKNKYDANQYFFSNNPDQTYTLTNGDKIMALSLDNMPRVVPDMKQFQIMPNSANCIVINNYYSPFKRSLPGVTPNGSVPFKMIADAK